VNCGEAGDLAREISDLRHPVSGTPRRRLSTGSAIHIVLHICTSIRTRHRIVEIRRFDTVRAGSEAAWSNLSTLDHKGCPIL
jgi:hypothetical protein